MSLLSKVAPQFADSEGNRYWGPDKFLDTFDNGSWIAHMQSALDFNEHTDHLFYIALKQEKYVTPNMPSGEITLYEWVGGKKAKQEEENRGAGIEYTVVSTSAKSFRYKARLSGHVVLRVKTNSH